MSAKISGIVSDSIVPTTSNGTNVSTQAKNVSIYLFPPNVARIYFAIFFCLFLAYKCKFCDRAFAQSNDLVKHTRSHVGENTYQCQMCPAAFRLHSELRQHGKIHFLEQKEKTQMENDGAAYANLNEENALISIDTAGATITPQSLESQPLITVEKKSK